MQRLIIFYCLCVVLFATAHEPCNTVNVITGEYCENSCDLELPGPFNITIERVSDDAGWKFNHPNLFSIEEEKTDGTLLGKNLLLYEYDSYNRLTEIKSCDKNGICVGNHVTIEYQDNPWDIRCCFKANEKPILTYHYESDNVFKLPPYLLKRVVTSDGQTWSYEYVDFEDRKLVSMKKNDAGQFLKTVYDEKGKVSAQYTTSGLKYKFEYCPNHTVVTDALGHKTIYRHDQQHLTAIEAYDENGFHTTELYYWNDSQLVSKAFLDKQGRVQQCKTFTYDKDKRMISECLWGNLTGKNKSSIVLDEYGIPLANGIECYRIDYEYGKKFLEKKIENGKKTTRYKYNSNGCLSQKIEECDGKIFFQESYFYDAKNQLIKKTVSDCGSYELTTVYNLKNSFPAYGEPESIEEYSGKLLKRKAFEYSEFGYLKRMIAYDAEGSVMHEEEFDYSPTGRLIAKNDHTYTYDTYGNLTALSEPSKTSSFVYDEENRLIKKSVVENNLEKIFTFTYDSMGNCVLSTDEYGNATRYKFDEHHRIIEEIKPLILDASGQPYQPIESKGYDLFGNLNHHTDSNGNVKKIAYNARGKPITVYYDDGTRENFEYSLDGYLVKAVKRDGSATLYERDVFGRILTVAHIDLEGNIYKSLINQYEGFHLVATIDSYGNSANYAYDASGRCSYMIFENSEGSKKKIEYAYDAKGNVKQEKHWLDSQETDFLLHIKLRDADGTLIETQIVNSSGKILKVDAHKAEKSKTQDFETTLNNLGQTVPQHVQRDSEGNVTRVTFNASGLIQCIEKRDAQDRFVAKQEMYYDGHGNKLKETHFIFQKGVLQGYFSICWQYDSQNKIICCTEYHNAKKLRETHYKYNLSGQLVTLTKPDKTVLNYIYDAQGKLKNLYSSDKTIDYVYSYDAKDHLIMVEDRIHNLTSTCSYDANHRITGETLANGLSYSKSYYEHGKCHQITLPDQSKISYEYDPVYLKSVNRIKNGSTVYSHRYLTRDLQGKPLTASLIYDCGTFEQDKAKIWSPWLTYEATFNEKGNLIAQVANSTPSVFHYDGRDQLIQDNSSSYTYDSLFNLITHNATQYEIKDSHQIGTVNQEVYYYDANGCLTQKGEQATYFYDALNRLIRAEFKDKEIHYYYDSFNRCLTKTVFKDGQQQTFNSLYVGNDEIGLVDENNQIQELRILGEGRGGDIGAAVAIELHGKVYAPLHDLQGSITGLVDPITKELMSHILYAPFGESTKIDNSLLHYPWGYFSKRIDPDLQFINFGHRHYDPQTHRWTTPDPLGYIDGPNPYAFLQNNPLSSYDLYGSFSVTDIWDNFVNEMTKVWQAFSTFSNLEFQEKQLAEDVLGPNFLFLTGYYSENQVSYHVCGQGEWSDKVRITALNGLLNLHDHWFENVKMISKTHGDTNVHYIFDPSLGWTKDAIRGFLAKCGIQSTASKLLAHTWKQLIADMGGTNGGGMIIHYAHSIGGTNTNVAKDLLTPEEQKMIKVITIGSATMVPNEGFHSAINYVSSRDFIGFFDPLGYFQSFFTLSNVVHIGSHDGFPLIDHLLSMETYARLIEMLGKQFIENYSGT